MGKVPKSITVIIREKADGELYVKDHSIGIWEIKRSFAKIPRRPYRLTYSLNPRGKYFVGTRIYPSIDRYDAFILKPGNHVGNLAICFLPKEWDGLRVSRKVEAIRK